MAAVTLDHRLVARVSILLSTKGFGAEVSKALEGRLGFHIAEGFAQRQGGRIILQRNLLETLRQRELDRAGEKLSQELGLTHKQVQSSGRISGIYLQRLQLTSGRFAMIENGLGFQLVPWSPSMEKKLGQEITGITRSNGGIDWSLGLGRGLEI